MWAVSTVTMLVLAGILPDFQLQSADGDSATSIAITAALGAGAFGLLSAIFWPLLVRLLLLVPALVLGLLVFFLNGSLTAKIQKQITPVMPAVRPAAKPVSTISARGTSHSSTTSTTPCA